MCPITLIRSARTATKSGKGCVNPPLLNLKAPAIHGNIAESICAATPTKEAQGVEHSQPIRYAVANK